MEDSKLNRSTRQFLKRVGVTSQQQIEEAVRQAQKSGKMTDGAVDVSVVLSIPTLGLDHRVEGKIELDSLK